MSFLEKIEDAIYLPFALQIGGLLGMAVAWGFHSANAMGMGMLAHLIGDALFFFEMKRQGCF